MDIERIRRTIREADQGVDVFTAEEMLAEIDRLRVEVGRLRVEVGQCATELEEAAKILGGHGLSGLHAIYKMAAARARAASVEQDASK